MGLFDSNKALSARCVGISNEGCGVVRIEEKGAKEEGMKVFVHDMLPGEKGRIRITERKNNMTYGVKTGKIESSKNRCEPMCPEFPRCGGCQIQHATYESQLQMKESMVRNCLVRMGHFPENEIRACMEKILPSREQFYYRNQMQYLQNDCTRNWISLNGINGMKFTSTNGSSIFLPAAGWYIDTELDSQGYVGEYWTSNNVSNNVNDARSFSINDSGVYISTDGRVQGLSVRPIAK